MDTLNALSAADAAEPSYQGTAAEHLDRLRALRETIPNFVTVSDAKAIHRLCQAASVPPEFVELSAVVAKKTETLGVGGPNAERMRDRLAFADAYGPVADEYDAIAQLLRLSIVAARNQAGSDALLVYKTTKHLAKRPETSELAPNLADLSRLLGARARRTKARLNAAKHKAEVEKARAGAAAAADETATKP
jgi:hypothetical protein